jgi:hypothetical protein
MNNMVMKKYFYILLAMCSIVSCHKSDSDSQGNGETTKGTGGIAGIITDVSSHKAIDGAYVLLMPVGKVNSGTGSDGRYEFDNLQAKDDYKLNVFKEGYIREEKTVAVIEEKTITDEGNIGLHKNTGTISISKTFIDMGTAGIGAVFSISTGENKNLSWKIVVDREWLTVDRQTGTGNSAINLTLDRNKLSSVREDNHAVITVSSTTVGDGSYDELWVTVFGTENGVNVGNINTQDAINITENSASVTGRNSGIQHDERGICYSKTSNPTIQNSVVADSKSGTGTYTVTLNNLSAGTKYYARAYAIDNTTGNAYYGNEINFTTLNTNDGAPLVLTGETKNITQKTATITGVVQTSGNSSVTQRGICYNSFSTPYITDNAVNSGSGIGEFSCELTGLLPNTVYHVRAFASNNGGTNYGSQISFTTLDISTPIVITSSSSSVECNCAFVSGNIESDGGLPIINSGICYSISQYPTIDDDKVNDSGLSRVYLQNLFPNTTYYARAYASNDKGTSYGNQISFTTQKPLPVVKTDGVSEIGYYSAYVCGYTKLTDMCCEDAMDVTDMGVCYSTSPNPTIYDRKISDGSGGIGRFCFYLTELSSRTTYYARAFATNDYGTSYGSQISFKTK